MGVHDEVKDQKAKSLSQVVVKVAAKTLFKNHTIVFRKEFSSCQKPFWLTGTGIKIWYRYYH